MPSHSFLDPLSVCRVLMSACCIAVLSGCASSRQEMIYEVDSVGRLHSPQTGLDVAAGYKGTRSPIIDQGTSQSMSIRLRTLYVADLSDFEDSSFSAAPVRVWNAFWGFVYPRLVSRGDFEVAAFVTTKDDDGPTKRRLAFSSSSQRDRHFLKISEPLVYHRQSTDDLRDFELGVELLEVDQLDKASLQVASDALRSAGPVIASQYAPFLGPVQSVLAAAGSASSDEVVLRSSRQFFLPARGAATSMKGTELRAGTLVFMSQGDQLDRSYDEEGYSSTSAYGEICLVRGKLYRSIYGTGTNRASRLWSSSVSYVKRNGLVVGPLISAVTGALTLVFGQGAPPDPGDTYLEDPPSVLATCGEDQEFWWEEYRDSSYAVVEIALGEDHSDALPENVDVASTLASLAEGGPVLAAAVAGLQAFSSRVEARRAKVWDMASQGAALDNERLDTIFSYMSRPDAPAAERDAIWKEILPNLKPATWSVMTRQAAVQAWADQAAAKDWKKAGATWDLVAP